MLVIHCSNIFYKIDVLYIIIKSKLSNPLKMNIFLLKSRFKVFVMQVPRYDIAKQITEKKWKETFLHGVNSTDL